MKQYLVGQYTKLVKFTDRYVTAKYIDWLNDHTVNRYLYAGREPISMDEIGLPDGKKDKRFAIMSNLRYNQEKNAMVQESEYAHYVGTISLAGIDWVCRKAEVGYMIGERTHWGCGLATEVIGLVSDYGFNRLGLHKLEAGVVDGNAGSAKALEKNGFRKYGEIPEDYYLEGKFLKTHRFYRLQEW